AGQRPRPAPPHVPVPNNAAPGAHGSSPMTRAVKQTLLDVRAIKRRLAAESVPPEDEFETFGPFASLEPRATVVVPLYNYAHYVGDAITSIARSDYEDFELIVIDDA